MSFPLPELDRLDSHTVAEFQLMIRKWLEEAHPEADFRGGVLHDLVIHPHAMVMAAISQGIRQLRREMSLPWLVQNADLARPEAVDDLLANFGITRRGAHAASGTIMVVLDRASPLTVAVSERFEARGILFAPLRTFAIKLDAGNVIGEEDRLLTSLPDGRFAFTIPVRSTEPGRRGQLQRGEPVRMLAPPPGFLHAYAAEDFHGGADSEANAELLHRWKLQLFDKAHSGRIGMSAWLRQQEESETIVAQSIVGFGDAEMRRDRHAIWPGSLGGRIDWYVRTRPLPVTESVRITATLVEQTPQGGIWRMALSRDMLPACYEILRATPSDSLHVTELVSQERSFDPTPITEDGWAPDIQHAHEAAFTPFQTLLLEFRDPQTPPEMELGTQQEWTVQGMLMPDLKRLQKLAAAPSIRPIGSDIVLKAPVPCFLSVGAKLQVSSDHPLLDLDAARHRVVTAIHELSFVDQIPAAVVVNQLQEMLRPPSTVIEVELLGRLLAPDGEVIYLHGRESLTLPYEPQRGISYRTICCYCDPRQVTLSISGSLNPPTPMF